MVKAYWIGIDGGGTKTTAVIGNRSGQIIAMYYGKSGNLTAISIEQLYERLNDIIEHLLVEADVEMDSVETIFAALAGADRISEQKKIYQAFQQSPIFDKLRVQSDVHAALATGTWGREGTLMIAGTGSILFGWHQNKSFRIGGEFSAVGPRTFAGADGWPNFEPGDNDWYELRKTGKTRLWRDDYFCIPFGMLTPIQLIKEK